MHRGDDEDDAATFEQLEWSEWVHPIPKVLLLQPIIFEKYRTHANPAGTTIEAAPVFKPQK